MPFAFLIIGIGLLIVAINGTQSQAVSLLKSEFVGTNSFLVWISAIAILGVLGYIRPIRPVANAMLLLVLLVIVVKNGGGFFSQFNQQIRNPTTPPGQVPVSNGMIPASALNPATGLLPSSGVPAQAGPFGYISPGSVLVGQGGGAP